MPSKCFFLMQMNGFSVSVIAESGSYDEVKQALILKGKKICARGHTIYFTWISQKCLWAVICSHLVLWQKTKVRHMMSRTTKDVPGFWLFCLLPSLCYLEMWISPQKNFCLYICYIAQLHAGGGIKGSISQVKKHGDKLSNYASIITWNMFW